MTNIFDLDREAVSEFIEELGTLIEEHFGTVCDLAIVLRHGNDARTLFAAVDPKTNGAVALRDMLAQALDHHDRRHPEGRGQ